MTPFIERSWIKRSWRHCAVWLAVLAVTGCVDTTEGRRGSLAQQDLAGRPLPEVMLTRIAFELDGTASKQLFGIEVSNDGGDHDQFGDAGKPVDLTCVASGLAAALPKATLLKPASVWPSGAPDRLPLLAVLDHLDQAAIPATRPDYLVLARFRSIEVERMVAEVVFEGAYMSNDRLVTAMLVIDRATRTPVFATWKESDIYQAVAHYFVVVPFIHVIRAKEPCTGPAREAGRAILTAAGRDDVRVALLAAFDDPFTAVKAAGAIGRESDGGVAPTAAIPSAAE